MENLTDFEAGRLTGVYNTLSHLQLVIEEVSPQGDSPTAIAIRAILAEVLERTRNEALGQTAE